MLSVSPICLRLSEVRNLFYFIIFLIKTLYFLQQFQVHSKIDWKVQRFPIHPLPLSNIHSLPGIKTPRQRHIFVTINEPTLMHHDHPKCVVQITVHLCCVWSVGSGRCTVTCVDHCSVIPNIFTDSKILSLPPHPPARTPWQPLIFLSQLCPPQNVMQWGSHSMESFQIGCFHLTIWI